MNGKQIAIVICGFAAMAFIVWYDLPIEFPWLTFKVLMLFLKLFAVLAIVIFAYVLVAVKNNLSKN